VKVSTSSYVEITITGEACPITITISPLPTSPGRFVVRLGDQVLAASSRQPFLDAARCLIDLGHPPNSILTMRHAGSDGDALRSKIGAAARLMVREDARRGPELVPYRAIPSADVAPPIAPKDKASTTLARRSKRTSSGGRR